ncbi:MAG: sodium-dependent transporter [Thermoplasmata archaeon]|nr:MAG: sodium-dependent transporter [Thermoplasmata archaeon]
MTGPAGKREHWASRRAFVLAAIGSAIGLGNIWRFPYVCYENGGGAFVIAYFIGLITAGIPLLILEFGLGHSTQGAAPIAMGRIHPKMEWFGWVATGVGFVICTYYAVIMSYCANYTWHSFTLAWGDNPSDFFFNKVIGLTDATKHPWALGRFMPGVFIGLAISWIWIILSIWKGTKTVGKVVYVTVLVPWAILIVFIVRGVTLPGALEGLKFYLTPVFSKLAEPQVWLAAYTQVFFSLSVGFAIMIAYASFLPRKSDIVKNAFIIGTGDALTAFLGGLAVFGALGYKAHLSGVPVSEVVRSGPGLAFVTYPEIISNLPAPQLFGLLFFLMLLTLAIDSAFSLVEAVAAATMDKWGWSHRRSNLTVGGLAFLLGIPLTFGAGLHWLDIVDRFMNQIGLSLVVLGETLLIGYYFGSERMRTYVNGLSDFSVGKWWNACIMIITPAVIAWLLISEVLARIKAPYGDSGLRSQEFVFGWLILVLIFLIAFGLQGAKGKKAPEPIRNA